jgi:putative ABC transport system permease protein
MPRTEGGHALPPLWSKAFRDLRLERSRSLLVVLSITLGIAAFSSVLSSYAVLVRELDRGYLATHPASAVLHTDAVDQALLADVRRGHGIAEAEARRTLRGRIQAGPGEWRTLVLFVVEDYGNIRIGRLVPQAGAWPPAKGELLIERDAMRVARAQIGDSVRVRLATGAERELRVSGTVHDVGQAQARMENLVYGYATVETLALLGEPPRLDQLLVVVERDLLDEARVRATAQALASWLDSRGHAVRRVDVPTPGKHPHGDLMGMLLLAKAGFGLFALLLSGILVANLLTAKLAAQVRQIGVMKAIGGTRARIARVYLAQALLLGVLATLAAVPLGVAGSRALCRYMAVFLNFDIASFAAPGWVYLLVAAVGLATPLLAAALPVARGTRVSVRAALADHGVSRDSFGTSRLDRLLARSGGASGPVRLALRNALRRRARLVSNVLTLGAAGVFFLTALNVRASLVRTIDRLFESMRYDLTVNLVRPAPLEVLERAVGATAGISKAEGWIATEASLAPASSDAAASPGTREAEQPAGAGARHGATAASADRFPLIVLPAGSSLVAPEIVAGRRLEHADANAIVVNHVLAGRDARLRPGRDVELRLGHRTVSLRVVGVAREPFSPAVGYVPLAWFEALTGHAGMASSLRVALERSDPTAIAAARRELERALEHEGQQVQSSLSAADRRIGFDQHLLMLDAFLAIMAAILAAVGGLGLATTTSLNVLERRREIGVMRAVGASRRVVFWVTAAEAVFVALLSAVCAAVVAWPVGRAATDALLRGAFRTAGDYSFAPWALLLWLVLSAGLAVAGSLAPAWQASSVPVREAISYE